MAEAPRIDVDASAAWLLPWAKQQLARFKRLAPAYGQRHFRLPTGEQVTLGWGFRDRIRIEAGAIGLAPYVDSDLFYGRIARPGTVLGDQYMRFATLDFPLVGTVFKAGYHAAGVVPFGKVSPIRAGADTKESTLGGLTATHLIGVAQYSSAPGVFTAALSYVASPAASLSDARCTGLTYDASRSAGDRWLDNSAALLPAEVLSASTGLSVVDSLHSNGAILRATFPTPFPAGADPSVTTSATFGGNLPTHRSAASAMTFGGIATVSYVDSATPRAVFTDHDAMGNPNAYACWVDIEGHDVAYVYSRDPLTMEATLVHSYELDWTAASLLIHNVGTGQTFWSSNGSARISSQVPSVVPLVEPSGDAFSYPPGGLHTTIPSIAQPFAPAVLSSDRWFLARGQTTWPALSETSTGPSYLDAGGGAHNMPLVTSGAGTPEVSLLVDGTSVWFEAGTPGTLSQAASFVQQNVVFGSTNAQLTKFGFSYDFAADITTARRSAFWDGTSVLTDTSTVTGSNGSFWDATPDGWWVRGWNGERATFYYEDGAHSIETTLPAATTFMAADKEQPSFYIFPNVLVGTTTRYTPDDEDVSLDVTTVRQQEQWVRDGVTLTRIGHVSPYAILVPEDRRWVVE